MSTLRDDLIRLAHANPELRGVLLPVIEKHGEVNALSPLDTIQDNAPEQRTASYADDLVDMRALGNLARKFRSSSPATYKMLRSIAGAVGSLLTRNEEMAVNKLNNLLHNADRWDDLQVRNQAGQIATLLGVDTPSDF